MSYQETLKDIYDMFPEQSHQTINKVFKECHNVPELTINRLLKLQKSSQAKPPKQTSSKSQSSTAKSPNKAPPSPSTHNHIFPEDFLRFPANVEYVQVDADSGLEGASPLQGIQDLAFDETTPKMNSMGTLGSLSQSNSGNQTFAGWDKIKSRFLSKKTSGYNQI